MILFPSKHLKYTTSAIAANELDSIIEYPFTQYLYSDIILPGNTKSNVLVLWDLAGGLFGKGYYCRRFIELLNKKNIKLHCNYRDFLHGDMPDNQF